MNKVRKSQDLLDGIVPYDPKYLPAKQYQSANENPRNIPAPVLQEVTEGLQGFSFNRYPDPLANDLRDLLAAENGLRRENVLCANGGDELLFSLALAWGGSGRKFLNVPPTFSVYAANAELTGTEVIDIPRDENYDIDEAAVLERVAQGDIDYVIITSPNNPTGKNARKEFLLELLNATDALILVDEAYFEFSGQTMVPYLAEHENLAILRTFSKAYSLAGVRLGYLLAHENVIREFIKVRQPYSVDAISQLVGCAVCHNRALFDEGIAQIIEQRSVLKTAFEKMPEVEVYDSDSNYVLIRIKDAGSIWQGLYDQGILVRDFSRAKDLEDCLRISVGMPEENAALIEALATLLANRA